MGHALWTHFSLYIIFVVGHPNVIHGKDSQTLQNWTKNEEIEIFRAYLRIPTVSTPMADYSEKKFN